MEREKFEESFKRAFDEAEVSPSAKVWTNIELDLEKARGGELKRRLLFYQMLAAASVVFAMAIGGAGYYHAFRTDGVQTTIAESRDSNTSPSASQPDKTQSDETPSSNSPRSTENQIASADQSRSEERHESSITGRVEGAVQPDHNEPTSTVDAGGRGNNIRSGSLASNYDSPNYNSNNSSNNTSVIARSDYGVSDGASGASSKDADAALPLTIQERDLPALYAKREVLRLDFKEEQAEVDPVLAMLAKLEQREREVQQKEDREKSSELKRENLWTSIGFSAGSFNAVQAPSASGSTGSEAAMAALAAPIVDQESKATGYSYSMGVNLGTRISERWVLQGGVNYLTHSSEFTSNNLVMESPGFLSTAQRYKPASTNAIVKSDQYDLGNKIVYSAPYSVSNNMRYISIPMQAGYLIVDKTFGVQLNAGVATDLFLQNTIEGEGDQLARTTEPSGSDSPYRTVNLSGLLGTEVSYRFGPHYRISLNPGIRYPFNTIYKSELGVGSSPLTFDVGLRFRYIFK